MIPHLILPQPKRHPKQNQQADDECSVDQPCVVDVFLDVPVRDEISVKSISAREEYGAVVSVKGIANRFGCDSVEDSSVEGSRHNDRSTSGYK